MSVVESQFVDFEGLRIEYDDRVLAPRPWTAAQSRWAAELIRMAPPGPVLELCSGAGHIGLLAVTLAPRSLVCVDADAAACRYLRRNADPGRRAGRRPRGPDGRGARPRRGVRGDHRRPAVGPDRAGADASRRTRSPPSTAAPTGWTWSGSAWTSSTATSSVAGSALLQVGPPTRSSAWPSWWRRTTSWRSLRSASTSAARWSRWTGSSPRASLGTQLRRQHLVGAVAPRLRRRLAAPAHRRDRPRGAVLDTVVVASRRGRRAAASARPGRARRRAGRPPRSRRHAPGVEHPARGAVLEVQAGPGAEPDVRPRAPAPPAPGRRRRRAARPARARRPPRRARCSSRSSRPGSRAARAPAPSGATASSWSPRTPRGGRPPLRAAGAAARTSTARCSAPGSPAGASST